MWGYWSQFHEHSSDFEKSLVASNKVITVRGKRDRGVPVIVQPDVKAVNGLFGRW